MYLLFLDESGTPTAADFVLGGVVIAGERWHQLRTRWTDITGTSGRLSRSEVKWSRARSTAGLAGRLADLLVEYEATAFAVQLRPHEGRRVAPELFQTGEDTYATALMFLAERFQHFLRHRDDYGVIVLDQRDGSQDDRLRRFFRRLAQRGTPFVTLDRIIDPIMLSPSHHGGPRPPPASSARCWRWPARTRPTSRPSGSSWPASCTGDCCPALPG